MRSSRLTHLTGRMVTSVRARAHARARDGYMRRSCQMCQTQEERGATSRRSATAPGLPFEQSFIVVNGSAFATGSAARNELIQRNCCAVGRKGDKIVAFGPLQPRWPALKEVFCCRNFRLLQR